MLSLISASQKSVSLSGDWCEQMQLDWQNLMELVVLVAIDILRPYPA